MSNSTNKTKNQVIKLDLMLLIKQERKLLDDFFKKKSFCSCNIFEINQNI